MNVNFDHIGLILNGAALTIQCTWRSYKFRKDLALNIKLNQLKKDFSDTINPFTDTFYNYLTTKCIKNNFLYDVEIQIDNVTFNCHSLVLWHNSHYFRSLLRKSDKLSETYQFKLKIPNDVWQIIQNFIYGYEITIPDRLIYQLDKACQELKIDSLLMQLNQMPIENFTSNLNKNQNNNCCSNPSLSTALSLNSINNQTSRLELNKPFQLISDNYKFFKCIINLYRRNKFTHSETLDFLSTSYIDYSQMNDEQLNKCILMLKTYLKLRNSDLILKIIEIYLNKTM